MPDLKMLLTPEERIELTHLLLDILNWDQGDVISGKTRQLYLKVPHALIDSLRCEENAA